MHELPVVLDIIRIVTEEANEQQLTTINSITIVLGELAAVMDESVQMYFELLAEGTPCEGAKLIFEHVPAMLRCSGCKQEFPHQKSFFCPHCGGDGILIKGSGRELYVKAIDSNDN